MKETLLVIAAALCVLFILFQLVRGLLLSKRFWKKRSPDVDPELEELCKQADTTASARHVLREIDTKAAKNDAHKRATYYSAAGEIALTRLNRPNIAIRYYYRALRNNPKCEPAFGRLAEILISQKKYRRFERTCWHLLSRMDEDDSDGVIWKKCWSGLATVYAATPKLTERSDAIRKMLAAMSSRSDDDDDLDDLDDGYRGDDDTAASGEDKCNSVSRIDSQ